MIEQISHIVGTMLGFKQNREPKEALFYIDEYFKRLLGMNSKLLNNLTDSALLDLLRQGSDASNDKILVTATLFKEEGDFLLMLGEPTAAYQRHCRALFLYLTVVLDEPKRDYDGEIAIVLEALLPYEIPPGHRQQLWRYHLAGGRYAEAENELFKLIDDGHVTSHSLEEAIASYKKLLELNEEELQNGGLSLQEVQEAIEQLEGKRS
jgi:tetratricopeptide (TPR) repeat protein